MADIVNAKTRSKMMAGIRGKDTRPELLIRKALFRKGFRYRLHDRRLPGKPDVVFPKHNAVIFVHGCFWHRHRCHLFKWPKTRKKFWRHKLNANARIDKLHHKKLKQQGWRILIVWECAVKGKNSKLIEKVIKKTSSWLNHGKRNQEISGNRS